MALLGGVVASAGCSFSYSSESSSDSSKSGSESSSSPFESSSNSSSPESAENDDYEADVAAYTHAYVVSGGSSGNFLSGIGPLAEKRGISDWESDRTTWVGVGTGLARANVTKDQLAVYQQNWSDGQAATAEAIQEGYQDAE